MTELDSHSPGMMANAKRKEKSWKAILVVILLLCGAGGYFILFLAQQKSIGETKVLVPPDVAPEREVTPGVQQYEGKYIAFSLPDFFEGESHRPLPRLPILEQQLWQQNGVEGKKLALTIQDITGYQLEEYGAFRLRKGQSEVYIEDEYHKNGISWTIFHTTTPVFEAGAFVKRGNFVVSIVLSSPTQNSGLLEELEIILDSVQF